MLLFFRNLKNLSTSENFFRKIRFSLPARKNKILWKHQLIFLRGQNEIILWKQKLSFPPGEVKKKNLTLFSFLSPRSQRSFMHCTANSVTDLDMHKQWCSNKFWKRMPILILCTAGAPFLVIASYTLDLICISSSSSMNKRFLCCICSVKSLFVSLHGKFNTVFTFTDMQFSITAKF